MSTHIHEPTISDLDLIAAIKINGPDGKEVRLLIEKLAGQGKRLRDIPQEQRPDFLRTVAPVNLTEEQDEQLLRNGYQAIPVCGKAPKLSEWQKGEITPERLANWRAGKPDHVSTGVRTDNAEGVVPETGTLFVLDLDLPDEVDLTGAETAAVDILGKTSLRRVGRKGCALFYRKCGNPSPKQIIDLGDDRRIELFGRGQVVLFGEHPDMHQPYRWTGDGNPLTVPLSALPEITDVQVRQYERSIREIFDAPKKVELSLREAVTASIAPRKNEPITLDNLLDLLAHIDPTMKGEYAPWCGITKLIWHGQCPLASKVRLLLTGTLSPMIGAGGNCGASVPVIRASLSPRIPATSKH
jgi:hypothetical protein